MATAFEYSDNHQFLWVYNFDADGVFTGTCHYCAPPGTGLPANSTLTPCVPELGETGVWTGEGWNMVDDLRGTAYWDTRGNVSVIMNLSDPLPDDAVRVAPPTPAAGNVVLFSNGEWLELTPRTGETYYSADGQAHSVPDAWFVLPDDCTFTPPGTPFDAWNGEQWVTDETAQAAAAEAAATELKARDVATAEQKRQQLRAVADAKINDLQDAIKLGIALDGDDDLLSAWMVYRVALGRLDISTAPDIDWPEMPQ